MTELAIIEIIKAIKHFMTIWCLVNVLRIIADFIIADNQMKVDLLIKHNDVLEDKCE